MIVTLRPMTEYDLTARNTALTDDYALDLHKARGISLDRARVTAERQLADLLPDGAATKGMLLFTAATDGLSIGWIWISLPDASEESDTAWIYNIEVAAEHRGKGYGRAVILAAEKELARLGVTRLGLNVFGDNTVAIHLYQSLGFHITSQQMAKSITPDPE
jgi:ribosomal protein S18 acetylase RimI-like enzyme